VEAQLRVVHDLAHGLVDRRRELDAHPDVDRAARVLDAEARRDVAEPVGPGPSRRAEDGPGLHALAVRQVDDEPISLDPRDPGDRRLEKEAHLVRLERPMEALDDHADAVRSDVALAAGDELDAGARRVPAEREEPLPVDAGVLRRHAQLGEPDVEPVDDRLDLRLGAAERAPVAADERGEVQLAVAGHAGAADAVDVAQLPVVGVPPAVDHEDGEPPPGHRFRGEEPRRPRPDDDDVPVLHALLRGPSRDSSLEARDESRGRRGGG
jgi:hypothetical protein